MKKSIIYLVMLISLVCIVHATYVRQEYDFEVNPMGADHGYNGTLSGTDLVDLIDGSMNLTQIGGATEQACNFTTSDSCIHIGGGGNAFDFGSNYIGGKAAITISFWFHWLGNGDQSKDQCFIGNRGAGGGDRDLGFNYKYSDHGTYPNGDQMSLSTAGDALDHHNLANTNEIHGAGNWHHVVLWYDGTTVRAYFDGSANHNVTESGAFTSNGGNLYLGADGPNGNYYVNGWYKDVLIWESSLTEAQLSQLNTTLYPGGPTAAPTYSVPTPDDGGRNNTQVMLNLSCATGNLTLWFGDTNPAIDIVIREETNNQSWNWTTNVTTDGAYYYHGACDISGANSTVRTWYYDTTEPAISIESNNDYKADNSSVIGTVLLTQNITITDNLDLQALEILIKNSSDAIVYNFTNETLSGTVFYFTNVTNMSTWLAGNYTVNITAVDSHTAHTISAYSVESKNKELTFNTDEGNNIEITSLNDADTFATKKDDRYEFEFQFKKDDTKRTFQIRADGDILYKRNSPFTAHFVVLSGGKGGNWIDFEGLGVEPTVTRKTDLFTGKVYYEVTFPTSERNLKFNSIGGLNVNNIMKQFEKTTLTFNSATITPGLPVSISTLQGKCSATEDLDSQISYDWIWYKDDAFLYSGTSVGDSGVSTNVNNITSSNTSVGDEFILSCRANAKGLQTTYTNSSTATIVNWGLDNCTEYGNISLSFTIFDENILETLEADIVGTLTYTPDSFNYTNYTIDIINRSSFDICIFPQEQTFLLDAYFQYITAEQERYYLVNLTISNTTQYVDMYNFNQSDGLSDLKAIVYNYYYDPFPNVIAKLQRYYPENNTWITVQIDRTDEFGKAIFYVYQETEDYKFVFDQNSSTLEITDSVKFICDTATACEQTFVLYQYDDDEVFTGMYGNISYNNVTDIYTLRWNDPTNTASSIRFLVEKQASDGVVTICDTSSSGASGSINCNISGYDGIITARAFRSASPETPWIVDVTQKITTALYQALATAGYGGNNEGMALAGFVMMGAIGFGAATGSGLAVVLVSLVGFIFVYLLNMTSIISVGMLMGGIAIGIIVAYAVKK